MWLPCRPGGFPPGTGVSVRPQKRFDLCQRVCLLLYHVFQSLNYKIKQVGARTVTLLYPAAVNLLALYLSTGNTGVCLRYHTFLPGTCLHYSPSTNRGLRIITSVIVQFMFTWPHNPRFPTYTYMQPLICLLCFD